MERDVQISSLYAVDVSEDECEGGEMTMLARKVDAGTACPPLAFMAVLRAFRDVREMHNTGLSFEKAKGMGSLLLVLLLRCAFACLEAEFAGKRASVQGTPSTDDKNEDMWVEAYILADTVSPQTFVGVEVLLLGVKHRGSADSGTLISVTVLSLIGTAHLMRNSPAEKSKEDCNRAIRGYFFWESATEVPLCMMHHSRSQASPCGCTSHEVLVGIRQPAQLFIGYTVKLSMCSCSDTGISSDETGESVRLNGAAEVSRKNSVMKETKVSTSAIVDMAPRLARIMPVG